MTYCRISSDQQSFYRPQNSPLPFYDTPIVLLHGFAQSSRTWAEVAERLVEKRPVIAIDLIGHGEAARPNDPALYQLDAIVADLDEILTTLGVPRFILLGYSMGGRIAAAYAAVHPERIACLILESAGLGPRDEEERTRFEQRDATLVKRLQTSSIEQFVDYWEQLPLFETQHALPRKTQDRLRTERLGNDPHILALMVQGSGQHSMPDLRSKISTFPRPTLYLAGRRDIRYRELAQTLPTYGPIQVTLLDTGHNAHLEDPTGFCETIINFCEKLEKENNFEYNPEKS